MRRPHALELQLRMNPLASKPTFDLNAEVREMDVTALNDFLRAYAKVDAHKGRVGIYAEVAAADGQFKGYVKPLIEDLEVVNLKQDRNPLEILWEGIVAAVVNLFKNHPRDRFGTKVPFSGNFDNPDVAVWQAVLNVLRNAFVKALPPAIEESVSPRTVREDKGVKAPDKRKRSGGASTDRR